MFFLVLTFLMQKVIGANIYAFSMSDYEDDSADHHQLGRFRGD